MFEAVSNDPDMEYAMTYTTIVRSAAMDAAQTGDSKSSNRTFERRLGDQNPRLLSSIRQLYSDRGLNDLRSIFDSRCRAAHGEPDSTGNQVSFADRPKLDICIRLQDHHDKQWEPADDTN